MTHTTGLCPRCGLRRQTRPETREQLCLDCRLVEPHWPSGVEKTCRPQQSPSTHGETVTKLHHLYDLRTRLDNEIRAELERLDDLVRQEKQRARAVLSNGPRQAKCGTDSGYYRHTRYRRELACAACLEAHAEAERQRKTRVA